MTVDKRILERIKRVPRPNHHVVIKGSTPVISFGDFTTAKCLTIGINPSSREFLNGSKLRKLIPVQVGKRLEDFESLSIQSYEEIDNAVAEKIWQGCQQYFSNSRNPYWNWFGKFEPIFSQIGVSYESGTASHVDLVQWATDPAWDNKDEKDGKHFSKSIQDELLEDDLEFFMWQNQQPHVEVRLINGNRVLKQVKKLHLFEMHEDATLTVKGAKEIIKTRTFVGEGLSGELVLAWSQNIPSMRVSDLDKTLLAEKIGAWAAQHLPH